MIAASRLVALRLGSNGWTGGAFSMVRFVFGIYLAIHFIQLLPWAPELFSSQGMIADRALSPFGGMFPSLLSFGDAPAFVRALVALGASFSLAFAVGWRDRAAALALWYLLNCLFVRNPLIANPSLPYVGWLLLAHALLPRAPWGSVDAIRGGATLDWKMPAGIYAAAWIVMAVGYSYSGYTKLVSPSWLDGSALERVLHNPLARPTQLRELLLSSMPSALLQLATWTSLALELVFAPLALVPRLRPLLWSAMLGLHAMLMVCIDFVDLSFGMVVLHSFTFDPAWIPGWSADVLLRPVRVFFDGDCGLCQGWVRLLLSEDRAGVLRFAPLGGETARRVAAPEPERATSLIVETADGARLERLTAVLCLLEYLGGPWRIIGGAARIVPAPLRDALYDFLARRRRAWLKTSSSACPIMPAALRSRFDP